MSVQIEFLNTIASFKVDRSYFDPTIIAVETIEIDKTLLCENTIYARAAAFEADTLKLHVNRLLIPRASQLPHMETKAKSK